MTSKVCQICGKVSGIYPLCKEHLAMKSNGEVIKNEKTGLWELINIEEKSKCILCGSPTENKYDYCKQCYYNIQDRVEELDKNQKPTKLKDYYYNAKDYAMRIYNEDKIYYQQITMSAISILLNQLYGDMSISNRLHNDIISINDNLKKKNESLKEKVKVDEKIELIKDENDKDKAKTRKTQDGHFVESELEIIVDDILYTNNILHAYYVKVDDITERSVYCDWYIPVTLNQGIYVELWGMKDNEKYTKNREEKIELYKKHNLPLIQIENDEIKGDTQRLRSNILSKIKQLKEEIKNKM